jgi:hypothetical protein
MMLLVTSSSSRHFVPWLKLCVRAPPRPLADEWWLCLRCGGALRAVAGIGSFKQVIRWFRRAAVWCRFLRRPGWSRLLSVSSRGKPLHVLTRARVGLAWPVGTWMDDSWPGQWALGWTIHVWACCSYDRDFGFRRCLVFKKKKYIIPLNV